MYVTAQIKLINLKLFLSSDNTSNKLIANHYESHDFYDLLQREDHDVYYLCHHVQAKQWLE